MKKIIILSLIFLVLLFPNVTNASDEYIQTSTKVLTELLDRTFDEFKNKSEEFIESLTKSDLEKFHRFRNIRNVIAHGNSNEYKNNKNNKGNLKDEFEKASLFLRNIIFKWLIK